MKTTILRHFFTSSSLVELTDPPASLALLVTFYRFFAFSFSGILFTSSSKPCSNNLPLRILVLSANLAALTFYLIPLFSLLLFGQPWAIHAALKNNSEYTLGKEIFDPTFATLKPVLKALITSMAWLMMAESTLSSGHCLLRGGRLIRQLAALQVKGQGPSKGLDVDTRWAVRSLTTIALAILAFVTLGLSTFARAYIWAAFGGGGGEGVGKAENAYLLLGSLSLKLLKHTYHYFTYSLYPLLFAYLMTTVKRSIQAIKAEVLAEQEEQETPESLTERLQAIKARLSTLQRHQQTVTASLALPLTLSLVVTTLLLTGTVCFLIVNSGLGGGSGSGGKQASAAVSQHFGLFFFNVAAFHLLRLVGLCATGSLAETAHEDLLLTLYGQISAKRHAWDVDSWLAFQELKKVDFRVALLGGLYSLRQATVLGVLAFVSNHIVVLLQTENYYGVGGSSSL